MMTVGEINYMNAMYARAARDYRTAYRFIKDEEDRKPDDEPKKWKPYTYDETPLDAMENIQKYFYSILGSMTLAFECCLQLERDEEENKPMPNYIPFYEERNFSNGDE